MKDAFRCRIIFLAGLVFSPSGFFAQRIDNVRPEIEGDKIHIYYDLTGLSEDQSVLVKAFMSTDGGKTYGEALKSVTGDAGIITGPGKSRCIVWNVFEEVDELVSLDVKFKVRADLLQSQQGAQSLQRTFKLDLNTNIGSKPVLDYRSYGFNLKGAIYLNQLGLGLRGGYFRTFRSEINYSDGSVNYPDTGYYWGYFGGAFIEYDFLRSTKYSLYPFLFLGQAKVLYTYNTDYKTDEFFKYSVFGSVGLGFDVHIARFFYLGTELEYFVSPWMDVVPSEDPDESLDGFCIGIVFKFVIDPG